MKMYYRLILSHLNCYYNCFGERQVTDYVEVTFIYFWWKRIAIKTWLLISEEHRQMSAAFTKQNISLV